MWKHLGQEVLVGNPVLISCPFKVKSMYGAIVLLCDIGHGLGLFIVLVIQNFFYCATSSDYMLLD